MYGDKPGIFWRVKSLVDDNAKSPCYILTYMIHEDRERALKNGGDTRAMLEAILMPISGVYDSLLCLAQDLREKHSSALIKADSLDSDIDVVMTTLDLWEESRRS